MKPEVQRRRARREGCLVLGTILAVTVGALLMYLVPWWLALEYPNRARLGAAIFVACVGGWLASYRLAWRVSGGEGRWALEEGTFELARLRAALYAEQGRVASGRARRLQFYDHELSMLERHRPGDPEVASVRDLLGRVSRGEQPLKREDVDLSTLPKPVPMDGIASDLLSSGDPLSVGMRLLSLASLAAIVAEAWIQASLGPAGLAGFAGLVASIMVQRRRRAAGVIVATGCIVGPTIGILAFILGSVLHLVSR